jgi:hypothetical protein
MTSVDLGANHRATALQPTRSPRYPMSTLFLSYCTQDAPHVSSLLTHLRPVADRQRLTIFKDDLSIQAGARWQQVLEQELNRAEVMVAVVSADALASTWCQHEWARAEERKILILPILLRDVHLPADHLLLAHQFANRNEPVVVAGAFLERVASSAAARVEAALATHRPAADLQEPSDKPAAPNWPDPPFAEPDHGRPDHHPPPVTRWLSLRPEGDQVRVTWLGEGRTLHTHAAPPPPAAIVDHLARSPAAVTQVKLRDAGDRLFGWLLPEDARRAVLGSASPTDTPVRLRIHNEVDALASFPWRALAFAGRWLVYESRWTVEEGDNPPALPDVRTGPGDRIAVLAPFAEPDTAWLIDRLQGWVSTTLRGPEHSPDVYVAVARSERDLRYISPRALLLVLAPIEVDEGELWVRLEAPGGGARSVRLSELTGLLGPEPQLLYLHDLDATGRPLPLPASLRATWRCVVRPGISASPRDQAEALLHFLHHLLACGCDPVVAALRPPHAATWGRAALSLLRVWTRHATWTVDNDRLQSHRAAAEIYIDRTAQRAEAWKLLREMLSSTGWHTTHALALGEAGDHQLELVGRQIVAHLRKNLAIAADPDLELVTVELPGLPADLDLERALLGVLAGRGPLDKRLQQQADRAPPRGRTLLVVDWGTVAPDAAGRRRLDSAALRDWLLLSHARLAPLCEALQGRLLIFHVLTAAADAALREKIVRDLDRIVPFGERHPAVRARLLPELSHVSRDDVRGWLREHAPWAPEPHEAVAASIIQRTDGRFRQVVQVLEDGLKFGFRYDLKAGLVLLASEPPPSDW